MIIRNYTKKPIKSGWIRVRIKCGAPRLELVRARTIERTQNGKQKSSAHNSNIVFICGTTGVIRIKFMQTHNPPINGARTAVRRSHEYWKIQQQITHKRVSAMHRTYLHENSDSEYGDCLGRQKSSHTRHAHCTRTLYTCARVRLMQAISN